MVIQATDMEFRLSGGSGNSDADSSLGGAISNTVIPAGLHSIFDKVTGDESEAGDVEYRWIYLRNGSSQTGERVRVYIGDSFGTDAADNGTGGLAIARFPTKQSSPSTLSNEGTAPTDSDAFVAAGDLANAINLSNLNAGESQAICLRRTMAAGAGPNDATAFRLEVRVDSGE